MIDVEVRQVRHLALLGWVERQAAVRRCFIVRWRGRAKPWNCGAWNGVENLWDEVEKECVSLPP